MTNWFGFGDPPEAFHVRHIEVVKFQMSTVCRTFIGHDRKANETEYKTTTSKNPQRGMLKGGLNSLNSDQWTNKKGVVPTISRLSRGGHWGLQNKIQGALGPR